MFVEVAGAVGKLAWVERASIIELVNKLAVRLRDGSSDIVVFGTGGVGKTTLGLLLSSVAAGITSVSSARFSIGG